MLIEQLFGTSQPTLKDLEAFLKRFKEDSKIEFKSSISENEAKNLLAVVVAFANSEGGILIVGVTDSREIVGCKEKGEDVENRILNSIEPTLSGLFVVETVQLLNGKRVLIVEVERSTEIHAVRLKKNDEPNERYAYYYRDAMSTRIISPSKLNKIAAIKKDFEYNFSYRISVFLNINELISSLLFEINFKREHKINEDRLKILAEEYLVIKDMEKALDHEIIKVIRSMRLEFLYREMWEAITEFYARLLETEHNTPHTKLTVEEDSSIVDLKNILNYGLNLEDSEADVDHIHNLIRIELNNKVFYDYRLDMLSARALFAYMLDYLTPQGYENEAARKKLRSFDVFMLRRKNFEWKAGLNIEDEWLTIDDLEKLMKEFMEKEPNHTDMGVFEKAQGRRNQYLYFSTKTFARMVTKLIELRDYLYESLSLPIKRNTLPTEYKD